MLRLILTLNNFIFNGVHWLQSQGTSMGTCTAPSYANIFMGKLESTMLSDYPYKPLVWFRYIDDIFFIWTHGNDKLHDFIEYVNNYHSTIKFTCEFSTSKIPFLDVMVHLVNQTLQTDLYSKPTDAHQYLHWSSCHPIHTRKGLVYSLAYRLRRICSTPEFLKNRLSELKQFLLARGYKSKVIDPAIERASSKQRCDAMARKPKTDNNRIPFVVRFNPVSL